MDALDLQKTEGIDRAARRFTLINPKVWALKVGELEIPTRWLLNLSTKGLRLQMAMNQCYHIGDLVNFDVALNGKTLFSTAGIVRWKVPCHNIPNMFELGIEFVDPSNQIEKIWNDKKLHKMLTEEIQEDSRDNRDSLV